MKGMNTVVISSLEDMLRLHSTDMELIARDLVRLGRRHKRATLLGLLALGGTLYLAKKEKETADKVDRLEESHRKLMDDYHNYVTYHAEYNPDKLDYEEDLDI